MEGRGYLDSYRNTSEELFIKTMTDNSIGMPAPTMEMLGFKNLSQNFRTDSEELFKSWLTNGENSGYNSLSTTHRTRQASRRISTELATLSCQQHGSLLQQKDENDSLLPQNTYAADEAPMRNVAEQGLQASNLYLARAWFHSSQPMTRSRSSELRRRYVAMQNSQTALGIDVLHEMPGLDAKQDSANPNGLNDTSMFEIPNHFSTFVSPSNSSSSTFTNPQMHTVDKVSSVVSMLKGTLERKKLNNHIEKEAIDENGLGYYGAQEVYGDTCVNQGQGDRIDDAQGTFQDVSAAVQGEDAWVQPMVEEGSLDMEFEGFISLANPIQMNTVSREPSQSESSAAAPVVSTGFDACDGPNNSGPTTSISKSSRKQLKSERSIDNGLSSKNIREQIYVNLKDDRKPKGSLVRYGSLKSAVSVDKGDPTKKRRVERSRK